MTTSLRQGLLLRLGGDAFIPGIASTSAIGTPNLFTSRVDMVGVSSEAGLGAPTLTDTGAHLHWRIRNTDGLSGVQRGVAACEIDFFAEVGGASVMSGGVVSASSEGYATYYLFPFNYPHGYDHSATDGTPQSHWLAGRWDHDNALPLGAADPNAWIAYEFSTPVHIREIGWKPLQNSDYGNNFDPSTGVVEYSDDGLTWYLSGNVSFSFSGLGLHRFTWTSAVALPLSGIASAAASGSPGFTLLFGTDGIASGGVLGSPIVFPSLGLSSIGPGALLGPSYVYALITSAPPEPAPDVLVYRTRLPPQSISDDPGVKWALGEFRKIEAVLLNMQKNGIQITNEEPSPPRQGVLYRALDPWDPLGSGDAWVVWNPTTEVWDLAF